MRRLLIGAACCALTGCGAYSRMNDTKTIHDPNATRIWIVQDTGTEQHVVMCDTDMLKVRGVLCARWPGAPNLPGMPPQ
jgi:hypothetical protein